VDPNLPVRGRYLALRLRIEPGFNDTAYVYVRLASEGGRLVPHSASSGEQTWRSGNEWYLLEPVAYFLPEHAADPSRIAPGEEMWVEVSVPAKGPPRPLRLAIKRDGVLRPVP